MTAVVMLNIKSMLLRLTLPVISRNSHGEMLGAALASPPVRVIWGRPATFNG